MVLDPAERSLIWQLTWENIKLGVLSALYGLVISLPLGIIAARWRWFYPPVLTVVNILYAVPSLALFIALIPAFGLTDTTVIIALTVFSLCVILPNVVAGLRAVPAAVTQAATAMGYGPLRRLVTVELPLAVPVIIAGLRVGVVCEHQPGQRRPAHRRLQPRLPVHRRAAAVLPDRDLRRPRSWSSCSPSSATSSWSASGGR